MASDRNNLYNELSEKDTTTEQFNRTDKRFKLDVEYIQESSAEDASNNLVIESSLNNIQIVVGPTKNIELYGNVLVKESINLQSVVLEDASINLNASIGGSLTVYGDMSLNKSVNILENLDVAGDSSTNNLLVNGRADISENLYVNGDVSFQRNLDVSGTLFATKLIGDGSELTGVGQLVLKQVLDASLGFVEISNLMVNIDTSLNAHVDISENLFVGGDVSINKNLKIDGIFTDGNYTFDTNGNVTGLGTVGCGAITSTGDLAVTGTITGNTSITLDNITVTIGELGVLDGVTPGTAGGSKALVLDSNLDITGLRNMTATGYIRGGYDTDSTSYFGRVALGYLGDLTKTDFASFSHVDKVGTSDYALLQGSDGTTSLNSSAGKNLHLRIGDATQFFIESTNKIGIGTEDSTLITEKLSVNGKVAALGYENFSDSRIKFDKKNIENGLNILKNLTPKLYNKLDDFDNSLNLRKEVGFIAQEVLMIDDISFVVKARENDGLYTLDYGSIFAINVAATKELDSLVRNLRSEVNLLKDENNMMKGVLNKLLLKAGENTI